MYLRTLASLALLLALPACSYLPSVGSIRGTPETAASVNEVRATHGLKPLRSDPNLTRLAAAHAADMARRNSLDHDGFMERRGPAGARAENVAYGCSDVPCVTKQWVNSSGHRANMLRTEVTAYGLASAVAPNGRRYWALELGE